MDPKLAKGLAKEFTKRVGNISVKRHDKLVKTIETKGNSVSKLFEKVKEILNTKNNTYAIHRSEFGSRSNPLIGLTILTEGHYNHGMNRDEDIIYGQQIFIYKKPPKLEMSDVIQFSISGHLIQRILERHPDIYSFDYYLIFNIVRDELKYVTIYTSIIRQFLIFLHSKILFRENYLMAPNH